MINHPGLDVSPLVVHELVRLLRGPPGGAPDSNRIQFGVRAGEETVDELDPVVVRELQADGRQSNRALAGTSSPRSSGR
jgi:hypothetical protein